MHIVNHTLFVIARRERSEGRGNPSCLEGMQTSLSLRFMVHSGSPRAFSPRDDKILYAGATLAGMALLGCRPFGPGPPRSAWLSASAVILPSLAHCFWKPTRKPMLLPRALGGMWLRLAERRDVPTLFQEPPRRTRFEPDAGPVGSITGLPVG